MKTMNVDDSAAMRLVVKKTLRQADFDGHEISEAEDGAKALAAIKGASPVLVLSDWNMPNMTGIELLEKLGAEGMATYIPMPDPNEVRGPLDIPFDGLDVKPGKKFDFAPGSGAWAAVSETDDGKPVALCLADANFAANAGAALAMPPPAVAKDAAKTKDLTDVMAGNLAEIMNICSRLLMTDTSPHLRLTKMYPAKSLEAPVQAALSDAKGRIDFEVNVPKHGPGTLGAVSV
ncbi:MAG: response regulator [Steroidobacteraceae bacterium]|jgi:hypothetical protein|nr:response regulator [Steroidobacteraceae bacterium]